MMPDFSLPFPCSFFFSHSYPVSFFKGFWVRHTRTCIPLFPNNWSSTLLSGNGRWGRVRKKSRRRKRRGSKSRKRREQKSERAGRKRKVYYDSNNQRVCEREMEKLEGMWREKGNVTNRKEQTMFKLISQEYRSSPLLFNLNIYRRCSTCRQRSIAWNSSPSPCVSAHPPNPATIWATGARRSCPYSRARLNNNCIHFILLCIIVCVDMILWGNTIFLSLFCILSFFLSLLPTRIFVFLSTFLLFIFLLLLSVCACLPFDAQRVGWEESILRRDFKECNI